MIKINWFLVSISNKNIDFRNINIKQIIFDEFNITVEETVGKKDNCLFAFASNRGIIPTKIEFENLIIIGDITIHNKGEIIKKYNLDKELDISISMGNEELISYLYKYKGIEFVKDVIGEFSFVLYDKHKKKIYAVRDQIGVKTLFWIRHESGYVFASDIFLLKYFFSLKNINYDYFKEYYVRNGILDTKITPYKDVYRIPSGSYMVSTADMSKIYKYWDLSCVTDTISYKNELDYFEEFSELLLKAVKDRLIKGKENSVMLSGGLDSTSLYGISKSIESKDNNFRVTPVSAVFDELKECDERQYIYELLNKYKDEGIYINCDNILMFEKFPYDIPFSYEPSVSSLTFKFTYNIVKKSVDNGLFNILSGYAGDHLLTGSLYVTRDFFNKGKFRKALSYITNYSIATNTSAFENFLNYTLFPNVAKEYIINNNSHYYKYMYKRLKSIKYFHQKELYYQISNAKSHLYTDRVIGAITEADLRHPFLDRRLVEFVYKIPGELRFSDKCTKYILRKAMDKYLTKNIVNRLNKTTHLAYTYKSIRKNWDDIFKTMYNPRIIEQLNLISTTSWKEEIEKWRNGINVKDDFWTLFTIELWFIQYYQKLNDN